MCRLVNRELHHDLSAVAESRQLVTATLQRWQLPSLAPDAELLVSEVVTNALLHAGGAVRLSVAVGEGSLEVGVSDRSPEIPRRPAGPGGTAPSAPRLAATWQEEGGRGLRLVDLVADEWGVAPLAEGKQVWFRLRVDPDWPHLADCSCADPDPDRVRLATGRFAAAMPGAWDEPA